MKLSECSNLYQETFKYTNKFTKWVIGFGGYTINLTSKLSHFMKVPRKVSSNSNFL